MCLAVPGRVVEWRDRQPSFAAAIVEFGGLQREVNMACVPEVEVGEYVLVHAGIAINRVAVEEADRMLAALAELDFDQEPS